MATMNMRNLTHKRIPALSPAAGAVIALAVKSGKTTETVVRELTRRPLRVRELLLVIEARARAAATRMEA